jgi:hypothetical protein
LFVGAQAIVWQQDKSTATRFASVSLFAGMTGAVPLVLP